MVRGISENDIGIKVLYEPPSGSQDTDSQPIVDIVAVHGLGAHPDDTWCKKMENGAYVNWLKDLHMLPKVVPQSRIMRYGYESQWFGEQVISQQAGTVAHRLLKSLCRARKKNYLRPIIFIAHCFGGLVVLKALVDAKRADDKWPGIFVSTTGLVFFGTPFRGAGGLDQVEMLRAAGSQYEDNPGLVQGAALNILASGNETLVDLMGAFFETRQEAHKALVACFYELKPSNVGAIVGRKRIERFVVDKTSGCLDEADSTENHSLSRNHFNMNKFGQPDEEDFEAVCEVVEKFVARSPQLVAARSNSPAAVKPTGSGSENVATYYEVPNIYVTRFIGRENIIKTLDFEFSSFSSPPRPKRLVLRALGGQGKSQLALEYCRRSRTSHRFRGIFWVDATSKITATRGFETIAVAVNTPQKQLPLEASARVAFVKEMLEDWTDPWLIVFDNYDLPNVFEDIHQFFPLGGRGAILVTSRHEGTAELGKLIELPPLSEDEALELLLREPTGSQSQDSRDEGSNIVRKLGYLALAIDQAAAYMLFTRLPLSQFILLYEDRKREILEHIPDFLWKYRKKEGGGSEELRSLSAFTTWEMSYQFIAPDKDQQRYLGHFISLAAFLDPSNIHEDLFLCYRTENPDPPAWTRVFSPENFERTRVENSSESLDCRDMETESSGENVWSSKHYRNLVFKLRQLSLLENTTADKTGISFSLHPLIKDWLQIRVNPEEQKDYTLEATNLLAAFLASSIVLTATPRRKQEVLAHMDTCVSNDRKFNLNALGSEALRHPTTLFGGFYLREGRYEHAEELFQLLLEEDKIRLGQHDPPALDSMGWLASTYWKQGRWKEAEELGVKVLEARGRVLGPDHPDTLGSMANLALTYWNQARWKEAEELNVKALEARGRVLGLDHPDTLGSMANLALTYWNQARWKEAEELGVKVLEARGRVLGPDHPGTLTSISNLALTYWNQARWKEAEELHIKVLEARGRVLGPDHPGMLTSMANLALTYWNQGRWKEAEELHIKVLEARRRVLGPDHPDTLIGMANLASAYSEQGRLDDAEELGVQVLEARKRLLGLEHPGTLSSMGNLALTYWSQGRCKEAEELNWQALEARRRVLGPDHPDTLNSISSRARILKSQCRDEDAIALMEQACKLQEKRIGPTHPDTIDSVETLLQWQEPPRKRRRIDSLEPSSPPTNM